MPSIRRIFYVAAAAALVALSTSANGQEPVADPNVPAAPVADVAPVAVPVQDAPPAKIVDNGPLPIIIPAAKLPVGGQPGNQMIVTEQPSATTLINPAEYQRIYQSIPFSRAEYRNNPGYRHDTTMEILTGNPRHQTVIQHNHEHKQPVRRIPAPELPSRVNQPYYYGFGLGRPWATAPFWFRGHGW